VSRQVEWAKRARKKLLRLDRPAQKRILGAIDLLVEEGRGDVRSFEGGDEYEYRLRVGDWRVLFSYLIGPRGDIYKR
jgi:mRNA-degrading endonuclease RelE of RelBE toxin-antitoxin system